MLEINNIMLGRNNNKLNIIIKYMKKDKLRLILMTMVTGLVAATIALYAYQVVSKGEITIGGLIAFLIPFLIIFFMIFFIVSRYKDVKAGMPLEDERSKKVMNRAAAMSFYVTLYWLILISFFEDSFAKMFGVEQLTVSQTTGGGIAGMAVFFFIFWLYYHKRLD